MAFIIDGSSGIATVDGSVSAPSQRGQDSNSGISYAADTIKFSTGGVERMAITNSGISNVGKILNVVSTTKTDTATNSTASNAMWDYTAFNAQITNTGTNKILISVSVSYAVDNAARISMTLRKDGATVSEAIGSGAGSRRAVTSAELHDYGGSLVTTNGFVFLHAPSAGTHTYNIGFRHDSSQTKTLYLNRSPDDNNSYSYFRPISTIVLMEVAP